MAAVTHSREDLTFSNSWVHLDNGVLEVEKKRNKSCADCSCQSGPADLLENYLTVDVKLNVLVAVLFSFKVSYSFLCHCNYSHFFIFRGPGGEA